LNSGDWTFLLKNALWLLILAAAWTLASLFALFWGEPVGFERLGALGIGLMLIGFQIFKFAEWDINSRLQGQMSKLTWELTNINPSLNRLKDTPNKSQQHRIKGETEVDEYRSSVDQVKRKLKSAYDGIDHHLGRSRKRQQVISLAEILLLLIATLQSGYGDLFHCWFNGKGWTSC